MHTEATDRSC